MIFFYFDVNENYLITVVDLFMGTLNSKYYSLQDLGAY